MKKFFSIVFLFAFCIFIAGCATTKSGAPDPVKSIQDVNKWIEENLW